MPPANESAAPTHNAEGFAKLFANLTAHAERDRNARFTNVLEDDVVTVSYEQALRKHQRRRSPIDESTTQLPPASSELDESTWASPPAPSSTWQLATVDVQPRPKVPPPGKTASVTVRLSTEECAQLHTRAADAGMSVSSYLRSCIFEAENLRAQVKEALAEIRTPEPTLKKPSASEPALDSRRGWRSRFFHVWHRPKQAATA